MGASGGSAAWHRDGSPLVGGVAGMGGKGGPAACLRVQTRATDTGSVPWRGGAPPWAAFGARDRNMCGHCPPLLMDSSAI